MNHPWAVPLGLTAAALAAATAGPSGRSGRPWRIVGTFAATCDAAFGAVVMTGSEAFAWPEVAMIGAIAAATALVGRTQRAGWAHSAAVLAVAGGSALGVAGFDIDQCELLLGATVALTGLAVLRGEFTPVDTDARATSALGCSSTSPQLRSSGRSRGSWPRGSR